MTADDDVEWAAADWLIALTDEPDDRDLHAGFADWLAADPAHPAEWQAVVRTYRALGAVDATASDEPPLPGLIRRPGRIAAWAGAAIAACLVLFAAPSLLLSVQADFTSGTAEIRRIELPDGSVVQLAPESAIAVDFGQASRRVELLDGIAYFDVASDPARPFSVMAAHARATAVGTAFEVRRVASGDTVAVREGVVEVETDSRSSRLVQGDALRVSMSGGVHRGTVVPRQIGLWSDKLVTARERPVSDLVDEIRRYYAGVIFVRGDELAHQPATGIYDMSDPAAALALIATSQGATLYRISPWILVLDGG
ncbi:MAG: FecR domain-containing protein [Thalassobaculaceae bacterium]|nr:FecR domain-containing protein [Thalassobaculaceae bacterium]